MASSVCGISYALAPRTRGGRAVIRTVENATGQLDLIRRARGHEAGMAAGCGFGT